MSRHNLDRMWQKSLNDLHKYIPTDIHVYTVNHGKMELSRKQLSLLFLMEKDDIFMEEVLTEDENNLVSSTTGFRWYVEGDRNTLNNIRSKWIHYKSNETTVNR